MFKSLPHIGMRNIKTSLAVLITLFIYDYLPDGRDQVYAGLAAIMCIQPTVESSFRSSVDRIIGTCMGGFAGYIYVIICSEYFGGASSYWVTAIGITLLIYICNIIKHNDAVGMSCIVFFLIATSDLANVEPISYTFNRVVDTLVGILIALAVNVVIVPKHDPKPLEGGGEDKS